MKAFYFAISFVVALMMVSACNMDKYELEKNLRTRAGSVNSYGYFYLAEELWMRRMCFVPMASPKMPCDSLLVKLTRIPSI